MIARTVIISVLALVAFAANSILCRGALGESTVDAASYTSIRLLSGALLLTLITRLRSRRTTSSTARGSWASAFFLFAYAVTFSFAYRLLDTGTGALLLFGTVQSTLVISALISREHPHKLEWIGLAAATGGLVYLLSPGLSAPPLLGSALMICAGLQWGFYTLKGRGTKDPVGDTTGNFVKAVPFALVTSLIAIGSFHVSLEGIGYAMASGALASGLGYVAWYTVLPHLTGVQSAVIQISVPLIAAVGGVIFLSETISSRLAIASALTLGGVAAATTGPLLVAKLARVRKT